MPTPNNALLLIDIQNDYFPGGKWALTGIEPAADNAARLLDAVRNSGQPAIHVRHEFPTPEAPFFAPESEGAAIHSKVTPAEGEEVVLKNHVNAFRDTQLKSLLEDLGVEELTICGAMSHMCVEAATRAAADLGYQVHLIHDACATRDVDFAGQSVPAANVHATAMSALGFAYANVLGTEEYLAQR